MLLIIIAIRAFLRYSREILIKRIFSKKINCQYCNTKVELDKEELTKKEFTCPRCKQVNYLKKTIHNIR